MRAECPITEASMETMATTTMTTAESQPFSSSRSSCSLRAPDDDAAAATASQSPSRPTRFTPPLAPGRKRTNFLNCSVPEPRRGSSADLEETTSARGDTSRCTRADSSLSQMSGSSLDSHHLGSCSEESKTEIGLDEVRDHSSENHARNSSLDSSLCESALSAAVVSPAASADSSASASLPAEAHPPTRPQHNASPAPAPALASLTAAAPPAEPTLSEREVDSIVEGVDSLVRELAAVEGSSEILSDIVLRTMREYSGNAVVQIYCLRVIWDICKDDENNKQAITSAGATDDIMRALQAFPENASVQEKGCSAIWSLCVNTHNRVVLVRAGACARIVKALRDFIATESLVRTAIGAMRTLSPELEAREHFASLQASKWISEAMVVHRSCVSVQRDGCAFLSNCAVNIEKQYVTVAPLKELDVVVQAMAQHRQDVSIMVGACFALRNYTHETKNCRTLRQCNGVGDIMIYAAEFQASSNVQVDAKDIRLCVFKQTLGILWSVCNCHVPCKL
jgi:hypothetical protein